MAFKDIQRFVRYLEERGELLRVGAKVSAELEITEIADRVMKAHGPAILFENVENSAFPVLINAFGSPWRMAAAIGSNSLEGAGEDIAKLVNFGRYLKVREAIKSAPGLSRLLAVFPMRVRRGACQEVVEEPDLHTLPVLKCWPGDAGRFFTLPLVFTKDPDTGQQNIGMYRMQIFDKKSTGMHWHLHKDGQEIFEKYRARKLKMPVSVVVGADPATVYASTAPLPKMLDELLFAGYLRRRPVPVVKCVTNDIRVPANAEFVLEGYVDPSETRLEGPFGDHTGYYSLAGLYPVFHVVKITRRRNPVYMATIVGRPPMEDCFMAKATERLFLPLLRMMTPEIIDMSLPLEGVFHNCAIISIDKRFPGHGRKVMNALWGMGQMMYTKMIVVVDKSVNPHDYKAVGRAAFGVDVERDLVVSDGPLDALDHASPQRFYGARLGIDATKKLPGEFAEDGAPPSVADLSEIADIREVVHGVHDAAYPIPGLAFLVVAIDKQRPHQAREALEKLIHHAKITVIVDKDVPPSHLSTVTWKVFNNIDARRDLTIIDKRLGIDATKKLPEEGCREWPDDIVMSADIKDRVDRRWEEFGIDLKR